MNTYFRYYSGFKFLNIAFQIKSIASFLILFLFCEYLPAQTNEADAAPFYYAPPDGTLQWTATSGKVAQKVISFEDGVGDNNDDGLMITFDLDINVNNENDSNKPIISFSEQNNNFLSVLYSGKTVTVRRYNIVNGQTKSYDYHLFDRLFEDISGTVTYRIKVYFTSNFMYFVTYRGNNADSKRYYLSPLYFGLDYQEKYPNHNSRMYRAINGSTTNIIRAVLGSNGYSPYINNVKIYSFLYDDWWKNVQQNFSSPNPATNENY
jgi:hypothetical protein